MATPEELTEEEVFANDIDPLDGIRELRKAEGASEESLAELVNEESEEALPPTTAEKDEEEIAELIPDKEEKPAKSEADPEEDSPAQRQDQTPATQVDDTTTGETSDEDAEKEESETAAKPAAPAIRKFRANGQDFEFTQEEILAQFETVFGQSMDYTQKMQKIAPYRKMISALESEGISQDQLNVAIDALKGDKGAIQKILETHKIESHELDPDDETTPYAAKDYGKNESQLEIEEVTSRIENDEEYKITVDVIDKQWDQNSREAFAGNPNMIQGLHNDIKTGVYDEVAPAAMKMKVLDGNTKSDIEYYMIAGEQRRLRLAESQGKTVEELNKPTQDAEDNFDQASSEAVNKRAASSTRGRADRKGVIDYLDDDDEAYDAWYKKTMASQ